MSSEIDGIFQMKSSDIIYLMKLEEKSLDKDIKNFTN